MKMYCGILFVKSDATLVANTVIENVQKRATRYVADFNKLEHQEKLFALHLPTLQCKRFRVVRQGLF